MERLQCNTVALGAVDARPNVLREFLRPHPAEKVGNRVQICSGVRTRTDTH